MKITQKYFDELLDNTIIEVDEKNKKFDEEEVLLKFLHINTLLTNFVKEDIKDNDTQIIKNILTIILLEAILYEKKDDVDKEEILNTGLDKYNKEKITELIKTIQLIIYTNNIKETMLKKDPTISYDIKTDEIKLIVTDIYKFYLDSIIDNNIQDYVTLFNKVIDYIDNPQENK